MPSPLLFDLSKLDTHKVIIDKEGIRKLIPHRYEMEQADGVYYFSKEEHILVGFKDVKAEEFWVRGHIPGRPLMPGVLMIEAAAQLSSIYAKLAGGSELADKFMGFAGVDQARFRGTVVPGDKLIIIINCTDLKGRRALFQAQGAVNGKMVFEANIMGMVV
ncbi:MAG: 3-hydroxyacyl-ACP dehydratase FabZ family protein [Candidatus Brocadiia bacterium]